MRRVIAGMAAAEIITLAVTLVPPVFSTVGKIFGKQPITNNIINNRIEPERDSEDASAPVPLQPLQPEVGN